MPIIKSSFKIHLQGDKKIFVFQVDTMERQVFLIAMH